MELSEVLPVYRSLSQDSIRLSKLKKWQAARRKETKSAAD
jgi:hypothetical protein